MHRFPIRVYYEDYLKFIERARSEWLRELGVDQLRMKAEGLVFAVRRIEADYLSPARFDDLLAVETSLNALSPARIVLDQRVLRDGKALFTAQVTVVCVNDAGRPARIPAGVAARVQGADLAPK